MDIKAVENAYARWAPVYDRTFGKVTDAGRRRAVFYVNAREGRVLEVGVGTGLSLPHYKPSLQVTGIDFSAEMLEKARERVAREGVGNIEALRQMDARSLDFPDDHFDTVVAMHVLSVVPEPERVMSEIARVVKPGGKVVITNHFKREDGVLGALEKVTAPLANVIGWHSDFALERVLGDDRLKVEQQCKLPPLNMMTFIVLEKRPVA